MKMEGHAEQEMGKSGEEPETESPEEEKFAVTEGERPR